MQTLTLLQKIKISRKEKNVQGEGPLLQNANSSKTSEAKPSIDEKNVETASETAKVKPKSSKVVRIKKQNDATEEEKTEKRANKAQPRQGWWNRDTE